MASVYPTHLPADALLSRYAEKTFGHTDAYCTDVMGQITIEQYIEAFYSSPVFLPERWLIGLLGRPADQDAVTDLAHGRTDTFSAWRVEARDPRQILMADVSGATRSWLMVAAGPTPHETRLYFGSAVVPGKSDDDAPKPPAVAFRLLMPFHRLYSRLLLAGARRRLGWTS